MEELKRDRVARVLKQRIGRGTVKNGSWLTVGGVAREFGVSRSTAKNALLTLRGLDLLHYDRQTVWVMRVCVGECDDVHPS